MPAHYHNAMMEWTLPYSSAKPTQTDELCPVPGARLAWEAVATSVSPSLHLSRTRARGRKRRVSASWNGCTGCTPPSPYRVVSGQHGARQLDAVLKLLCVSRNIKPLALATSDPTSFAIVARVIIVFQPKLVILGDPFYNLLVRKLI